MNQSDYSAIIDRIRQTCGVETTHFTIVKKSDAGDPEYEIDFFPDRITYLKRTDLRRISFEYDFQSQCFKDKAGVAAPEKCQIFNTLFKRALGDLSINKAQFLFKDATAQ